MPLLTSLRKQGVSSGYVKQRRIGQDFNPKAAVNFACTRNLQIDSAIQEVLTSKYILARQVFYTAPLQLQIFFMSGNRVYCSTGVYVCRESGVRLALYWI